MINSLKKLFGRFSVDKQAPICAPKTNDSSSQILSGTKILRERVERVTGIAHPLLSHTPIRTPAYSPYRLDTYYRSPFTSSYPLPTESKALSDLRSDYKKISDKNIILEERVSQLERENAILRDRIKNERDGIKDLGIEEDVV